MVIDWGTVIPPLLVGIPSFLLGYWGLRRSVKVDAATERSGVLAAASAGTTWFVDQIQEDNKEYRERLDTVTKERDDLKRQLTRYQRKYGNGDNGP